MEGIHGAQNREARFYMELLTHDIKNLNQGITGYLELMTMLPDTTDVQRKFLEEALSYVRMSSNLINSIEMEAKDRDSLQEVELLRVVKDSGSYLHSIHTNSRIDINMEEMQDGLKVEGNILLVDLFLYLMDFMVKRSERSGTRIKIGSNRNMEGLVHIRMTGDFAPVDIGEAKKLFSGRPVLIDEGRGKLLLCRNIAERFGGTITYEPPRTTTGATGGGFMITLRGCRQ